MPNHNNIHKKIEETLEILENVKKGDYVFHRDYYYEVIFVGYNFLYNRKDIHLIEDRHCSGGKLNEYNTLNLYFNIEKNTIIVADSKKPKDATERTLFNFIEEVGGLRRAQDEIDNAIETLEEQRTMLLKMSEEYSSITKTK